ncbi:hypothetical protein FSARC_5531 [Fusarium sarcochroum]|uniref:CENP-V/GFA domain-containing protein n=1 Tax=Fusarium sarcochroum TaxID=1208366 RepID=A0A8H4TZ51_9HYPO|nr:hypothetical protein FSARC_5531 [Fusarium sarcochroum]
MTNGDSHDITLTAQCLCKAHTFSTQVPRSKLPLDGFICHCTSCRNVTGAMYTSCTNWLGPVDDVLSSDLTRYEFTTNSTLFFCRACSSPLFWEDHYQDRPRNVLAFTGVLNNAPLDDLINFSYQHFVGDTNDGGVSPWLQHINRDGVKPRLWKERSQTSDELSDDCSKCTTVSSDEGAKKDDIPFHCRCRGVDLVFSPGRVDFSSMDAESIPFYIDPKSHKHLATLDPCSSCRGSVGVDIMSWTFALFRQIDFATRSEEQDFPRNTHELKDAVQSCSRDPRYGTLAMYRSSPDVQRYFCLRCSATVFYAVDDRPDVIDVAVGLLHASEGARAESLLAWHLGAKMMAEGDLVGGWREGFAKSVKEASEQWRIKKGVPKTWARLASEGGQKQG